MYLLLKLLNWVSTCRLSASTGREKWSVWEAVQQSPLCLPAALIDLQRHFRNPNVSRLFQRQLATRKKKAHNQQKLCDERWAACFSWLPAWGWLMSAQKVKRQETGKKMLFPWHCGERKNLTHEFWWVFLLFSFFFFFFFLEEEEEGFRKNSLFFLNFIYLIFKFFFLLFEKFHISMHNCGWFTNLCAYVPVTFIDPTFSLPNCPLQFHNHRWKTTNACKKAALYKHVVATTWMSTWKTSLIKYCVALLLSHEIWMIMTRRSLL